MWPFRKREARIDDNAFYRELFAAIETKTGVTVTWRTALQAVTAMACARVIAEGLAQVPCKLFKEDKGKRTLGTDKQLYDIIHDSPNEWQTSYDMFEQIGLHLVFCGNYFAFVNRYRGQIEEILPYEPQHVEVKREGWRLRYWVTPDLGNTTSQRIEIPNANMWHIRGPSWNGWMGLEGVKLAREAIGLAMATEEHGAKIFKNGAKIGGLLTTDQLLSKEKAKEIREAWEETYAGNENTGKTAVVWGGLKYMATQMLNDHAQLLESRNFQVEETCRSFRVLPIMVGHMNSKAATFASSEQMFLAHVVHTMGPWYSRIERSANKFLLTPQERASGYYFRFITAALLRGSAKDRAEYFSKALGSGGSPAWMTQDEVRALDELDAMGGNASILREPTNVGGATPKGRD